MSGYPHGFGCEASIYGLFRNQKCCCCAETSLCSVPWVHQMMAPYCMTKLTTEQQLHTDVCVSGKQLLNLGGGGEIILTKYSSFKVPLLAFFPGSSTTYCDAPPQMGVSCHGDNCSDILRLHNIFMTSERVKHQWTSSDGDGSVMLEAPEQARTLTPSEGYFVQLHVEIGMTE